MTFWIWPDDGRAVLEFGDGDSALELMLYYGDGRLRAAWLMSEPGRLLGWAEVGSA